MAENKIRAIIVIYNKEISKSITYNNIKFINGTIDILVVDNSDKPNSNEKYCKDHNINYLSMHGNKGLSKAYNAAIDKTHGFDVIILFDDDTKVVEKYFEELKISLDKNPDIDIFAPIIKGQDGLIYSPNEFNFLRNHFISSPNQEVSQNLFNAISSCLAIRMHVFDNYRFNEKLFLDQVDQFFFYEQRKLERKFSKLNVEIIQNFYQRGTTLTPEAGWKRLKLRIYDIFRHARLMENRKYIMLAFIKCCGVGIQIGKKSKSLMVVVKSIGLSINLLVHEK